MNKGISNTSSNSSNHPYVKYDFEGTEETQKAFAALHDLKPGLPLRTSEETKVLIAERRKIKL